MQIRVITQVLSCFDCESIPFYLLWSLCILLKLEMIPAYSFGAHWRLVWCSAVLLKLLSKQAKVVIGFFQAEQPESFGTRWSEEVNGSGMWISAAAWPLLSTESLVKIELVAFQKLPELILYICQTIFHPLALLSQPPKPSVCKGRKITLQVIFSIRMIRLNESDLAKL